MKDMTELTAEQRAFILPYLPHADGAAQPVRRPFVTLTYAQSLDSMISLGPGLRTTLSGPESKSMTHFLRLHHDAILIGAGTAKADDPSLNCRYAGATIETQPRPVIVGSSLPDKWLSECKARSLAERDQAKYPWVVCVSESTAGDEGWRWVDDRLEIAQSVDGRLDWKLLLQGLASRGIGSIMVEGGASVINELLQRPDLVHSVIVTVAPTWLGREGVQVAPPAAIVDGQRQNVGTLQQVAWCQFGQDMVLCGRLRQ